MRIQSLMIVVIADLWLPQSVHAQPPPPKITGQVVDSDGKPVAGADVAAWWSADNGKMQPFQGVKTDKDGKFSLSSEGAFGHGVLVLDQERKAGAIKLFKGESLTLNFQLGPLVHVHGSVFSKELNKLPPWTTVSICMGQAPSYPKVVQSTPKEKGFAFLLPAGEYTLLAEGSGVEQLKKSLTLSEEKRDLDLHELNMEATTITRRTGKPAPAWTVTAARGVKKEVKLSDFKGKWVLIVLWAAGDMTTNHIDLPNLIDLCESRSKDRDKFEIIAFHDSAVHDPRVKNFEQLDEKLKSAKEWYWRGRDLPFPILIDATGKTMKDFGIRGLPMMILIDPEGKVVGLARQEELEAKLPELPLDTRIMMALDKRQMIFFDDPPLDRAVQILSDQFKIPIRLDKEKLEAEGIATDDIMPIKFNNGILSLRSALNLLLDGMELGFEQDDKGLIVRPRKIGTPRANKMSATQRSSANRLEKILDQRVTFNLLNMPLNAVIQHFQNTARENFILEPADRRARLLDVNARVTGSAKDVRLREALTELLRPYKMSFEVRDEAVVLKFKAPER